MQDALSAFLRARQLQQLTHFCGHPDTMAQAGERLCKWPKKQITWNFGQGQLPGLTPDQVLDAFKTAWGYWAAVCDLEPLWLPSGQADITMHFGAIDGGFGTLAWSEMPCSAAPKQLRQLYDTSERWNKDIDLTAVACHEIGHALGIPHLDSGNLMAPVHSPTVLRPQAADIAEAVRRYGKPSEPPVTEEYVVTFRQPVSKIVVRRSA